MRINSGPCQLYQMSVPPSGAADTVPPSLRQYIGQYYEIQNSTFNSSSPIYVSRPPSNLTSGSSATVPSVWLYYNPSTDRWELADSYLTTRTVLLGYSHPLQSGQFGQPQPSTGPEAVYGLPWTFVNGNYTVNNVTFSCTCT